MLVVVSKVKAMVKAAGFRTSAEFLDELDSIIQKIVIQSAKIARRSHDHTTLKPKDLPDISIEGYFVQSDAEPEEESDEESDDAE